MKNDHLQQEWLERIADYKKSGLTMRAWCEQHGFTMDRLKYWLYKNKSKAPTRVATGSPSFLSLTVTPSQESPCLSTHGVLIHIGPACIEVFPGFEPHLLRDVVDTLRSGC